MFTVQTVGRSKVLVEVDEGLVLPGVERLRDRYIRTRRYGEAVVSRASGVHRAAVDRVKSSFPIFGGSRLEVGDILVLIWELRLHERSIAISGMNMSALSRLMQLELIGFPVRTYWDFLCLPKEVVDWYIGEVVWWWDWLEGKHFNLRLTSPIQLFRVVVRDMMRVQLGRLSDVLRLAFDNLGKVKLSLSDGDFRKRATALEARLRHVYEFTKLREWDDWRLDEVLSGEERAIWDRVVSGKSVRPFALGLGLERLFKYHGGTWKSAESGEVEGVDMEEE